MTIFLIRHSTTLPDPGAPADTWQLSSEGRCRARHLAQRLLTHDPQPAHVVTSTETKALDTGRLIAAELGIPCDSHVGLDEQARQSAPWFPSPDDFQAAIEELFHRPDEMVFGEETADQAFDRMHRAVSEIDRAHPGEPVAIVSHGTVMSLFIAHHNPKIDVLDFWRRLTMPDCLELSRPGYRFRHRIEL
jgi:broad specificity phosphatase PhoE